MKKRNIPITSKIVLEDSVGKPILFFIIPFSFNYNECKSSFERDCLKMELNFIDDVYTCCGKEPSNSLLRQIFYSDSEVFSANYLLDHPFQRAIISKCYINFAETTMDADIVVTFHNDGYGTILLKNKISNECTTDGVLDIVKKLHNQNGWTVDVSFKEKESGKTAFSIEELLMKCLNPRKANTETRIKHYPSIGTGYPFIVAYSDELDIIDVHRFVSNNINSLYGIAFQDTGWRRVKGEIAKKLLDIDLSRRKEYCLYMTPKATLEIDSKERLELIRRWAKIDGIDEVSQYVRVLMGRVLLLETLILQKHIMISLNSIINKVLCSNYTNYTSIVKVRRAIAHGLCDYFNIRSQNENNLYFVEGSEWLLYGQRRLRIDKLYSSLKERIDALETSHNLMVKNTEYKQTSIIAFFTLLFGSTAASDIVDLFLSIPIVKSLKFEYYSWLMKLSLTLLFVIISVVLIFNSISMSKKSSNKEGDISDNL